MLFNKQKLSLSPKTPHLKEILSDILQGEKIILAVRFEGHRRMFNKYINKYWLSKDKYLLYKIIEIMYNRA